ncbi:MAG: response regulator [Desulfuromonadales bacterium]|nr:response regulator [Desulfuromonadales bacterium]
MLVSKKLRIILLEDEKAISELLRKIIQGFGHEVLAFSVPTACPFCKNHESECLQEYPCADVVLSDNMMPNLKGIDYLKLLRTRNCKIIDENQALMSAAISAEHQEDIRALGCQFFQKPFMINTLQSWLNECAARVSEDRLLADL